MNYIEAKSDRHALEHKFQGVAIVFARDVFSDENEGAIKTAIQQELRVCSWALEIFDSLEGIQALKHLAITRTVPVKLVM